MNPEKNPWKPIPEQPWHLHFPRDLQERLEGLRSDLGMQPSLGLHSRESSSRFLRLPFPVRQKYMLISQQVKKVILMTVTWWPSWCASQLVSFMLSYRCLSLVTSTAYNSRSLTALLSTPTLILICRSIASAIVMSFGCTTVTVK